MAGYTSEDKPLTPKQRKAIDNYMRGMSQAEALRKAGYAEWTAKTDAHSVYNLPQVRKEIERRQKILASKAQVDARWIIERLMKVADANLGDHLVIGEDDNPRLDLENMSDEMRYAITGIKTTKHNRKSGPVTEIEVKQADKLRALEMLGKHLGMFQDRVKVEAEDGLIERLQRGRQRVNAEETDDD